MNVRTEEPMTAPDPVDPAEPIMADLPPPGFQASIALAMDSLLTFIRLFKTESALALSVLPALMVLNIIRLPVYLLTWISFAIFVATAVYSWTENLLLTAGAFFILHLALAFVLERVLRKTSEAFSLRETRKGVTLAITGIKERFQNEQNHP